MNEHDMFPKILLGLVILFFGAKLGGFFAHRWKQPAVLGELLGGILIGNLGLLGFNGLEFMKHTEIFKVFSEIGVVLLLFEVGLESHLADLIKVGLSAFLVAVVGVIVPFGLGFLLSQWLLPQESIYVHGFLGASLCATSVGITARVFKDLGKIHMQEAKIILGAAVIDDVLGLIVLAIVQALIVSADSGEVLSMGAFFWIGFKSLGFLLCILLAGVKLAPYLFQWGGALKVEGMFLAMALSFCFLLAYFSHLAGLAPIVGAFAAGLVIDGSGYQKFFGDAEHSLEELIHPVSKFFVPIFFVHMGMDVDVNVFFDVQVVMFGLALTAAAILGKQACGFAVLNAKKQKLNRWLVGIGMIPRGEVGLIFAMIGAKLTLHGQPVVNEQLFAAMILMVMLTTLITPFGLGLVLNRRS